MVSVKSSFPPVGILLRRLGLAYPSTANQSYALVGQYGDVSPGVRFRSAGVRLRYEEKVGRTLVGSTAM